MLRLAPVAILAVTLTALVTAPSHAAPPRPAGPSLTVAPASVAAGAPVAISGRVVNPGRRARTVRVRALLARAGVEVRLGSVRVARVPAGGRRAFAVRRTVPASLAPGRYRVRVCTRSRCRSADARLRVTAAQPVAPAPVTPAPATPAPATPAPVTPPPAAQPPAPPAPIFSAGARSGGDVLFPQIGNGGYDAQHYDLELAYDPATRTLEGEVTMTAIATQNLWQLSMDLQGFTVTGVAVGAAGDQGTPVAAFSRELPAAASPGAQGIASKLVITPRHAILAGARFAVTVTYTGEPQTVVDPDGSSEGWVFTDTGGVVVCQPIGCQGVYPSNNIPSDKATFDTSITVPDGLTGLGVGELRGTSTSGGRTTWRWSMAQPISTYLTTATVGDYELRQSVDAAGRRVYNAVDRAANGAFPAFTPAQLATLDANLARQEPTVTFLEEIFGPYPFDSYGAIVANAHDLGYALEVATKPVYTSPSTVVGTHTHELLHQWIGNSATHGQIQDLWIHEGMARWIEWHWAHERNGNPASPATQFQTRYAGSPASFWSLPPGRPTAEQLFDTPVYDRGGMTFEALRQTIGDAAYFAFLRAMADRFRYRSIATADVIALAEEIGGRQLDAFFDAWLYTAGRPPHPMP